MKKIPNKLLRRVCFVQTIGMQTCISYSSKRYLTFSTKYVNDSSFIFNPNINKYSFHVVVKDRETSHFSLNVAKTCITKSIST